MLAFTAAALFSPAGVIEHPLMLVEQGRVIQVVAPNARSLPQGASLLDFGNGIIAPGYLDLHIHGSSGYDVMDERTEALPAIERLLARHGVTAYFPTTVTAPIDTTLRALERLADAIENTEEEYLPLSKANPSQTTPGLAGRARPVGIHLEGPFISHARRGVHPADNLLPPKVETFERFWQAARGRIRMLTIAPELDGALELIASAAARGVCVSVGHSDADFTTTERAIDAGARHATHTFNAMRPLDHRSPGILGAVLSDSRLSADIIADGVHVDPSIVKLFARAKGLDQTLLITDGIAATGMPDGRYRLGLIDVDVKGGRCVSEGRLAGSVLTMDRAVRNLMHFAEWDLPQAVSAASRNPARIAGCENKGALAAGADADFIVLDGEGNVLRTFVGGVES
jgi:N-acetylglucosamine-6-phosphate deacetylase